MRKQNIEHAAFAVATQIRTVEDIIEDALAEVAELQSRMVRARATTGVATATGHAAFEQLSAAIQGLVAARGGVAHCHVALVETKQYIPGLRTVGFGDTDDCPPSTAQANLRVVA